MSDMHAIVESVRNSENFKAEARYIGLGGYTVAETVIPREAYSRASVFVNPIIPALDAA